VRVPLFSKLVCPGQGEQQGFCFLVTESST
jgi:hypothetical protein